MLKLKHKTFFVFILIVFIGYSKDNINTQTIHNTPNNLINTKWIYYKDTPNYIEDYDSCDLLFSERTSGFLVDYNNKCLKYAFGYIYIKPKITIKRFNSILEGSVSENIMTLYDKDGKKYLFILE